MCDSGVSGVIQCDSGAYQVRLLSNNFGKITLAENYVQTWVRRSSDVLQTYSRRNGLGLNRLDVLRTYYRRTTGVKIRPNYSKRNGKRTLNVTFQLIHKDIYLNYVPTFAFSITFVITSVVRLKDISLNYVPILSGRSSDVIQDNFCFFKRFWPIHMIFGLLLSDCRALSNKILQAALYHYRGMFILPVNQGPVNRGPTVYNNLRTKPIHVLAKSSTVA
eukprot:sb/3469898/